MTQRDYILRMIEQMAAVLKRLLRIILRREVDRETLDRELRAVLLHAGLDLDVARICDAATLEQMIAPGGELDPGRCWLVAESLYVDGVEHDLENRFEEARASLHKARHLYGLLTPDLVLPSGFPEAKERIEQIEERLEEMPD